MTHKVGNLGGWTLVDVGISLPTPTRRNVRLELNCEWPTSVKVEHDGKVTFLTAIVPGQGPQTVEFVADGPVVVVPSSDGEVWFRTDDGDRIDHPVTTESFTSLEQRMEMSPELEVTILKAELRKNARLAEQARQILAAEALRAGANPDTGELEADGTEVADNDPAGAASGADEAGAGAQA